MRILITMKSLQNYEVNFEYHRKVQGFVYSFLKNSKYDKLHDEQGYKFFCFSNIFKTKNSDYFHLMVSSPDKGLIEQVYERIMPFINEHILISLGSLFKIVKVIKIPEKNLQYPLELITESPIITRIPIEKYYGKTNNTAPYKSVFWRCDHPVDLFIDNIESNIEKKYLEFAGKSVNKQVFERYEFKKQVSTKIEQKGAKFTIIGTLWKLKFSPDVPHALQKFVLDCGLGERNSLGFGFVNPIIKDIP